MSSGSGAAETGVSSAFVVVATLAAAVAGFGVALGETLVKQGWLNSEGRIVILDAGVGAFVVAVVFAVAGVVTWALVRRFGMPRARAAGSILVGVAIAVLGLLIGLLVMAVQPGLWPAVPLAVVPAVLSGAGAAVTVWRETGRGAGG